MNVNDMMTYEERKEAKRQYNKERYQLCLKLHRCVDCGAIDDLTRSGAVNCQVCRNKNIEYKRLTREKRKELIEYRIENKICISCGNKLPDDWSTQKCPDCTESQKMSYQKRRNLRKEHGVCLRCGKEDAYTMNGRCYCFDCCEKDHIRQRKKSEEIKVQYNQNRKELYDYRKENHLCPKCGKELPEGYTKINCKMCLGKARRKAEISRRERGIISHDSALYCGLCVHCHKELPYEGHKVCKKCYDLIMLNLSKAKTNENRENHIWHRLENARRLEVAVRYNTLEEFNKREAEYFAKKKEQNNVRENNQE